ncbi:MAG: hypothetical protein OER97_10250 [Gammaproteobacteria bacterium]|nr:hypothetical protein [Gammaproteobacteria bacterium]
MATRAILALALSFLVTPAFAERPVKHTSIVLDANGTTTAINEIVAYENGDTMFLTYGVDTTASASGSSMQAMTGRGALQDKMVFKAATEEVISVHGGECQRFGADSEAPGGYSAADMADYQQEMQAAQVEMDKAFAEMAKQNPQMAEQMRKALGGRTNPMMRPRDELELVETGNTRTIDDFDTEEFQVRDVRTGTIKHTVWAARNSDVNGGALVGGNNKRMFAVFQSYMDKMGVGAFGSTSIMSAIGDKMETHYPILSIDHGNNQQTKLQDDNGVGPETIDIECNN